MALELLPENLTASQYMMDLIDKPYHGNVDADFQYYSDIMRILRPRLVEAFKSHTGSSVETELTQMDVRLAKVNKKETMYCFDYSLVPYHIEFTNAISKRMIRLVPSQLRDNKLIITFYEDVGSSKMRVHKNTTIIKEALVDLKETNLPLLCMAMLLFVINKDVVDEESSEVNVFRFLH